MAASTDHLDSATASSGDDDERHLRTCGLLGFRDLCVKKGIASLRQLTKNELAKLVKEFFDQSRIKQGCYNSRSLRRFHIGLTHYFRPQFGSDFDMERDPAFADVSSSLPPSNSRARSAKLAGNVVQTADAVVISTEDLTKIGQYFWRVINTPRGLQQKVWFDLMIHLGAEGIENQHSMRRESFVILKSQTDGRRRLQWKVDGKSRGPPVQDDPESPLCPVKTFQLYLSKLNLACPALFQRPHDGITKASRFWFHMFPLNNTMLALMMYDISKDAGLARVYPNFCTQVLPEKGRFYELARKGYLSLENLCVRPVKSEEGSADGETVEDSIPLKLCAQCLTPVKLTAAQKNKGILCSVPCFEAFVKAKEMRQNVKVSFKDGTRVPQYTLATDGRPKVVLQPPVLNGGQSREEAQLLGKNIPQDVYKFIQQVAKIQALGQPAKEGVPMLFKEDGSNVDAKDWSLPAELMELTMNVGKQTTSTRPVGSSLLQKNIKRIKMEPTTKLQGNHRSQLVQKVPIQMIQKGQLVPQGTVVRKLPGRPGDPTKVPAKIEPAASEGESGRRIGIRLQMQPVRGGGPAEGEPTLNGEGETAEERTRRPSASETARSSPEPRTQRRERGEICGSSEPTSESARPGAERPSAVRKDVDLTRHVQVRNVRSPEGDGRVVRQDGDLVDVRPEAGHTKLDRNVLPPQVQGWRAENNAKQEQQHRQCEAAQRDSRDARLLARADDARPGGEIPDVPRGTEPQRPTHPLGSHGDESSPRTPGVRPDRQEGCARMFQSFGRAVGETALPSPLPPEPTAPWQSWQGSPHQPCFPLQHPHFQHESNFRQEECHTLLRTYEADKGLEGRRGCPGEPPLQHVCDPERRSPSTGDQWKAEGLRPGNEERWRAEPKDLQRAPAQDRQLDRQYLPDSSSRPDQYRPEPGFPDGTFQRSLQYGNEEEQYLAFSQHDRPLFRGPYGQPYGPYPSPYQPQQYPGPQLLQQYSPYSQYFPATQHHLPRSELAAKLEIPNGT